MADMSAKEFRDYYHNGGLCVYCVAIAEAEEHYPPRSASSWGLIAPVCTWCNSTASNHHPFDIDARISFVKSRLARRYAAALRMPAWTTQELAELSGDLRTRVLAGIQEKRLARSRLEWTDPCYKQAYVRLLERQGQK